MNFSPQRNCSHCVTKDDAKILNLSRSLTSIILILSVKVTLLLISQPIKVFPEILLVIYKAGLYLTMDHMSQCPKGRDNE